MCVVVLAVQRHRLAAGDAVQTRRGRYIIPLTIGYEISRGLAWPVAMRRSTTATTSTLGDDSQPSSVRTLGEHPGA